MMTQQRIIASYLFFCVALSECPIVAADDAVINTVDENTRISSSILITKESYRQITSKFPTVFLKLFSPKCSHCQTLAPDWEVMAQQCMSLHEGILVGEIDCSTNDPIQNKWCDQNFHLSGLPTLLYGDPSVEGMHLKEYAGDRSISALTRFCKKIAEGGPNCSPSNLPACDEETRSAYEMYWTWSEERMDKVIIEEEANLASLEEQYDAKFRELHDAYNAAALEFHASVSDLKAGIRMLEELKEMASSQ
mmetsp:Transcript_18/g.98  ORF Transcript_18/g.98 Transcript_18/m.98 type:complete len:250 (+) Transcript_18:2072-2821(+)